MPCPRRVARPARLHRSPDTCRSKLHCIRHPNQLKYALEHHLLSALATGSRKIRHFRNTAPPRLKWAVACAIAILPVFLFFIRQHASTKSAPPLPWNSLLVIGQRWSGRLAAAYLPSGDSKNIGHMRLPSYFESELPLIAVRSHYLMCSNNAKKSSIVKWSFSLGWKDNKIGQVAVPWIQGISCSPSGRYLAALSSKEKIYLVDWQTLKSFYLVDLPTTAHYDVACDDDKSVYYWPLPQGTGGNVPVMRRTASGVTQPCGSFNSVVSNRRGVFGVQFRVGNGIVYIDVTDIKHPAGKIQTFFHKTERSTWLNPHRYYIGRFISSDDGQWWALQMSRDDFLLWESYSYSEFAVWQDGVDAQRFSLNRRHSLVYGLLGIQPQNAVRVH